MNPLDHAQIPTQLYDLALMPRQLQIGLLGDDGALFESLVKVLVS